MRIARKVNERDNILHAKKKDSFFIPAAVFHSILVASHSCAVDFVNSRVRSNLKIPQHAEPFNCFACGICPIVLLTYKCATQRQLNIYTLARLIKISMLYVTLSIIFKDGTRGKRIFETCDVFSFYWIALDGAEFNIGDNV